MANNSQYYEVCSFHYDFLVQFGNLRTGNILVLVCNPANLVDLDFRMMDLQVITHWSSAVDCVTAKDCLRRRLWSMRFRCSRVS